MNKYRQRNREFLRDYLKYQCCGDCGERDPVLLEFNHIDPTTKKFNISDGVLNKVSLETLETEIDKCSILCANCHRSRTAASSNWYKWNKEYESDDYWISSLDK